MTGLEYILLHVQEPILFVIRKQHRYSSVAVTPMADYYIIAGYVYQAPDLNSLISSRLSSGIHHLLSAFEEAHSFVRYHPTKGYTFDFARDALDKEAALKLQFEKKKEKQKEESSSAFQRARVDLLLGELMKKFPPKMPSTVGAAGASGAGAGANAAPAANDSLATKSNGQSTIGAETSVQDGSDEVKTDPDKSDSTTNGPPANAFANRSALASAIPDKKPRIN